MKGDNMERLTEQGITYGSCEFMDDGIHEWINRLSAYEDTGRMPDKIILREYDIELLQKQNKTYREEIYKLRSERDYWEHEAKKWCDKLGEIRILAEARIHNTP